MPARETSERRIARSLRALLEGAEEGSALAETMHMLVILGGLEHFIPQLLAEIHPYWNGESLDGFFLGATKKLGHDSAQMRGLCILISDQALTPFEVHIRLSSSTDKIDWMECRLGERGDGEGGMKRIPWSKWSGHSYEHLQDSLKPVDWAYAITFGEGAGTAATKI